jgi:hypothetical protein
MLLPCMIGEEKPYHLPCMGACAVATELKTRDGESRGWKEATPGSSRPSLLLLLSRAPQRAGCFGFGVQLCPCARPRRRRASLLPTLLHQGQTIIPVPYVRRRSKSPSPPACYLLVCYKVNPVSASPLIFSSSLRLLITALQLFGF